MTKTTFSSILLFIIISGCISLQSESSSESMEPVIIQNQLDYLINTLEVTQNEKKGIENFTQQKSIKYNKNNHLQDEVVNAIHDLNKDFIEYDDILSEDQTNLTDNSKEKNILRENENIFEELKLNNSNTDSNEDPDNQKGDDSKITDSTKNYIEEVNSLTNNINKSYEAFDEFDKNQKEKKLIQQKIDHVKGIIDNVTQLKNHMDSIKKDRNLLEGKRHKMKNLSDDLVKQYKKYLKMEKNADTNIHQELEKIRKDINLSFSFKNNFEDIFKVFGNLINFHKKMNIGNEEDLNKKLKKFKNYINDLNKNDKINSNLITKIESKIALVKKNFANIPVVQRIKVLNHYLSLIDKVKNYNQKIINTKNQIVDEYKKFSFDSISTIIKNFQQKKSDEKFNKVENIKNTLKNFKQILQRKNLINQTKEKIMKSISQINLIEKNIEKKEDLNEKLTKIIKEKKIIVKKIQDKLQKNKNEIDEINSARKLISLTSDKLKDLNSVKREEIRLREM